MHYKNGIHYLDVLDRDALGVLDEGEAVVVHSEHSQLRNDQVHHLLA